MRIAILKFSLKQMISILLPVLTLLVAVSIPAAVLSAETSSESKIDDVRVLIDISGSMKRTDPQNLRIPAMRLFTTLLPVGTHAGVWTFGEWVNMMVKHGPVDKAWKQNSLNNIKAINSRGLYTNIEEALKQATSDWTEPDKKSNRNLILLTDGLVDISKDPETNAASRKAILEKYLPQLESVNAKIHTIALSQESDRELMRQLASATGGWFETIESANGLERLFLKMFEKVAQADSLPMKNNLVKIDKSIKEVTFLIFRKDSSQSITLTTPSKKELSISEKHPEVQWHQESRYDLVTISNPEIGSWKINANLDPDNRAMVVTDLKLKNTVLPNSIEAGVPLSFNVHLEEGGEIITRKEFLRFVRVKVKQHSEAGKEWEFKLKDNGKGEDEKNGDGVFTVKLNKSLIEGEHNIIIDVNGTTFKRSTQQTVKIFKDPVDVQIKLLENGKYMLSIIPYKTLIESNSIQVDVEHILPSNDKREHKVPRINPAEWRIDIDPEGQAGSHELIIRVAGNRPDGSAISSTLEKKTFSIEGKVAVTPQEEKKAMSNEEHIESGESKTNWLMVSLRLLVFNIMFGLIGFAGYKIWPVIRNKIIPSPPKELVHE